ncbi:sperm head and tail associated protein-like [Thomomys bottae]
MTSSPPFLVEFSTQASSPHEQCNIACPPGVPLPCEKEFNPVLTIKLPLSTGKEFSDYLTHPVGLSSKTCKRCKEPLHPREPYSCSTSPCLPRRIPSPPVPSPPSGRCSFEPFSPLLGRLYCQEPSMSGSLPQSPCSDRRNLLGSPSVPQQSAYCSWISPPQPQQTFLRGPGFDQRTFLCYCGSVIPPPLTQQPPVTSLATSPQQPPVTSPVTSPQLVHVPLETGPIVSPPLTQETQGTPLSPTLPPKPPVTVLTFSPPLVHQVVETRPVISSAVSHRVLKTGSVISPMLPQWSPGRGYTDPLLSSVSSPPNGNIYHGSLPSPDSDEPSQQLDRPFGKNCGSSLPSQAGKPGFPSSVQDSTFHYSHLSSESHLSVPGNTYCAINVSSESSHSPTSSQAQAPRKPCFEPLVSWEGGGNSYLLLTPSTVISVPPCPSEPSLSHCPYPALYFPSPLGNQFIAPPQSPPQRSYKEPPLTNPVLPQVNSPKFSELRQPRVLHKCNSLTNIPQHTTPAQTKPHMVYISPLTSSQPSGGSDPSCIQPSTTAPSNSCPKESSPKVTLVPTVVPGIIKTVVPSSLPHRLPQDPALPSHYAKYSPQVQVPSVVPPCSTRHFSVVPSTSQPNPLPGSLSHPVGSPHNLPAVPPCCTYGVPRGPPLLHCKPLVPPCSTHIYSFIPLRTPFDPHCLPIVPRTRPCSNNVPCDLPTYSVASQGPCKESPQAPHSCPLPSTKTSICSTNPSGSSTVISVISDCESTVSTSKLQNSERNQNQNKSPRHGKSPHRNKSRSRSSSPQQKIIEIRSRIPQGSTHQDHSDNLHHHRDRKQSKSPHSRKGKSPHHKRQSHKKSPHHRSNSHGQSKSPQTAKECQCQNPEQDKNSDQNTALDNSKMSENSKHCRCSDQDLSVCEDLS